MFSRSHTAQHVCHAYSGRRCQNTAASITWGKKVCSYTLVSFSFFSSFYLYLFAAEIFLGPRGEHIPPLTVVQSLTIADPPSPSDSPDSVNALKGKLSKLSGQCSSVDQLRYQSTFIISRVLTLQRTRSQIM